MNNKEYRILKIMERWVKGEIKTDQADRELQITGVELPKSNIKLGKGNEGLAPNL